MKLLLIPLTLIAALISPIIAVAAEPPRTLVIADFEKDNSGFTGAIHRSLDTAHSGKASGRMDADFSKGGDPWITATRPLPPGLGFKQLSLWVKSTDAAGVTIALHDSTGQTLQQRPAFTPNGQWQQIILRDFEHGPGMQSFGGANDGKVHWPARDIALILEKGPLGGKTAGTLWADDIEAVIDSDLGPDIALEQAVLGNVFLTGEPVHVPVQTRGDHITWTVTDFWGAVVAKGDTPALAHHAVIAPGFEGQGGYFQLDLAAKKGSAVVGTAHTSFALLSPFENRSAAVSPFGVMTHFAQGWDTDIITLIARAGVFNSRDELYWAKVEAKRGTFSYGDYDPYMSQIKTNHVSPLTPFTFSNPNYDGGQTPYTQEGFDAYARYCVSVLAHYGDQIKSVEIWNEYNGSFATGPAAQDRSATYVKMLKTAYEAIKKARPDVTVLGCSTAGVPMPYLEKIFKAGGLAYMDGVSVHPYRYGDAPEGIERQVSRLQTLIRKYNNGRAKPIWVTEIGWFIHTNTAPGEMAITEADQAKFLVRSYTLMFSAGVVKAYWYLFRDYGEFATMGLVRSPDDPMGRYTPKPSYVAMAVMARQLTGARFVKQEPTLNGVYSLLFNDSAGGNVRVMWSPTPRKLSVHSRNPLTLVDMMGTASTLRLVGGQAQLRLSDSPIYLHGAVESLPPPEPSDSQANLANSSDDFSDTQGKNHWRYGYFESGATPGAYSPAGFAPMPAYRVTDWTEEWGGAPPYLGITSDGQHPGVANGHQIWSVRRWVSSVTGPIQIVGSAVHGAEGDGVNLRIFVDGQPVFAQQLGGGQPVSAKFDLRATVHTGSTVDFAIDPGPAINIDYDATQINIEIRRPK